MDQPRVLAKADNLNELNPKFEQKPLTQHLFLNSVPKSGSHLLKNIVRMFVPVEQQYQKDFIQYPTLKQHHTVFLSKTPMLSWGHMLFTDAPAILLKDKCHILLVRDPYDWVLARTRFFLSENFQYNLEDLKYGRTNIEDFMNMMIFGLHNRFPNMKEIYEINAVQWLGTKAKVLKYEDIVRHLKDLDSKAAKAFFEDLLGYADIALPDDWKERVRIGSDREQSGTARENLELKGQTVPSVLPDMQKRLVDHYCPGLRDILGYQ